MSKEPDVVIVGAGIAGLVAALRLAERGRVPLVLEKGEGEKYACNTRISGGAFHIAHQDVAAEPKIIRQAVENRTRGDARPDVIEALCDNVGDTVRWLKGKGVRFIKVGHESYRQHTLAPPIQLKGRHYWEGRGGDVLLRTLERELDKAGGRVQRGTRATGLVMKDGQCIGVHVERKGEASEILADSVVICDGGYHSNVALLNEFISPAPEKLKQRNAGTGGGDGLRMAREAGARLVGLDRFYGHVLARDAMHNEDLSPFPMMDFVCAAAIVVDADGRRFMDEGLGGVTMANAIARQTDPLAATVIFDAEIWNTAGREYLLPANPLLTSNGGELISADSVADLAHRLEVPAVVLKETVARYNAAVDEQRTGDLEPPRSAGNYQPQVIRQAPFHAVRLCAGITYTMGGIAVDGQSRVLNQNDAPIRGLYAAGCAAGGLEGGRQGQVTYIGGLARSAVMAARAADSIAAENVTA